MKKVLMIIGIIVVVLAGIILLIFNMKNKKEEIEEEGKTAISANTFNDIMGNKGYIMTDSTNQFAQYKDYIIKAYVAEKDDYQIEFYELANDESAINMYNTNKLKFEEEKGNKSAYTTKNFKSYATYSLTTDGKYKYLSRIYNTLIYIDVDVTYKDTIKEIMKELGY